MGINAPKEVKRLSIFDDTVPPLVAMSFVIAASLGNDSAWYSEQFSKAILAFLGPYSLYSRTSASCDNYDD
jgi:hypothetical protein